MWLLPLHCTSSLLAVGYIQSGMYVVNKYAMLRKSPIRPTFFEDIFTNPSMIQRLNVHVKMLCPTADTTVEHVGKRIICTSLSYFTSKTQTPRNQAGLLRTRVDVELSKLKKKIIITLLRWEGGVFTFCRYRRKRMTKLRIVMQTSGQGKCSFG